LKLTNKISVSAFQYTNLLSTQLIGFWAIATVMIVSFFFLKVRYHIAQIVGILICCGGLGVLIASDRIRGASPSEAANPLKGDLFALVSATAYGLSNVGQEFLVSKRPMYEVIGQLGFWGQFIIAVQGAIFNRDDYANSIWTPQVGGYLIGYTLLLTWFYTGAPIVFRMASAAFFNIGLLTANFWGLIVATAVFGYTVHFLYPVAFVLIMIGHFVYYGTEGVLGEAKKPWLGENQEGGDDGIGTARRKLQNPNVTV
jgi:solute carrier family 35 protein F1/2